MDYDSIRALITSAKHAPKPPGAIGIHQYIGSAFRANIPFTSPRPGCAAASGLRLGRQVDHAFAKVVAGTKVQGVPGAMAKRCFRILMQNDIVPVLTQLGVAHGNIYTRLDAVGIRKLSNGKYVPVAIEIKSTQQKISQHTVSYDLVCQRRPTMGPWAVPNSERNAHRAQAYFGCMALNRLPEFTGLPCQGVVVVVCTTGARLYTAEPLPTSLFEITGSAPRIVTISGPAWPRLPAARSGGALLRKMLTDNGFRKIKSTGAGRWSCVADRSGTQYHFAIIPQWKSKKGAARDRIVSRLHRMHQPGTLGAIIYRTEKGWHWESAPRHLER